MLLKILLHCLVSINICTSKNYDRSTEGASEGIRVTVHIFLVQIFIWPLQSAEKYHSG